jgi:hypothetical protein
LEPLCTANGKVGIENSLVFPQNVSYVAIWTSNSTCWYIPKRTEKTCPHRNVKIDIYQSIS